ncbi:FtsX-like permease family protein [Candidatus Poribacteria bacterium]|nr:FtsX-like permease family protein [Candidatus Poribacteria bacterium]MYA55815.1 FtsX-like permease family protein [Candidatus Poribacteria bacterium]
MKFRDAIIAGVTHILQNRLRAALSILGILIGVASVLCMIAIGDGAKQIIADDIDKLGGANQVQFVTRHGIWKGMRFIRRTTERYTLDDAYAIEAECPDVLFVLPKNDRYRGSITTHHGSQAYLFVEGVTIDYAQGMRWEVQYGRFFSESDIHSAAQVCVLGAAAATELFGEKSALGHEIKIKLRWRQPPVRCRVVGIMATKGRSLNSYNRSLDDIVCVPLTMHQQRLSGDRYIERIIVFFQKETDVYSVIESVRKLLRKRHRGTDDFIGYRIPQRTLRRFDHIEQVIKIALGGIASFSLFVSGISIMNICLVSVGEKTREIGLRKSVGARRRDIFWQFLTESVCLCLCGGILGIGFGYLTAHGMALLAVKIVPIISKWPVVLSLPWILISVFFSLLIGVGFGLYPAMRAGRLSPIDALRTDR